MAYSSTNQAVKWNHGQPKDGADIEEQKCAVIFNSQLLNSVDFMTLFFLLTKEEVKI